MTKQVPIARAFSRGKAFIPFFTCGDPDLGTTAHIIRAAGRAGADLIEFGVPFSDPTAEGPVIQASSERALHGGATTDKIFEMIGQVRPDLECPFVIMTYANVVFSYGAERFARRCAEVGVSGVILPDAPFEEKGEFEGALAAHNVDLISLIAPTSEDRIEAIARAARGFLYVVSSMGVTGMRSNITTDVGAIVEKIRSVPDTPCAIGFGISSPEQAARMGALSDGVIVGSALVSRIHELAAAGKGAEQIAADIARRVSELKGALS